LKHVVIVFLGGQLMHVKELKVLLALGIY